MLYHFIKMLVMVYLRMVLSVRVKGLENIPKKGAAVLIANHPSTLDGFLILTILQRKFNTLVNSRFFYNRIYRWFLIKLGAFPVENGGDNKISLIEVEGKLDKNELLLIFPEGKVNDADELLKLKNGFVYLATNAKVPVIPIVIYGSHIVMKSRRFSPNRGKIYINILPSIVLNDKIDSLEKENVESISKDIKNMMMENLEELKENLKKYEN